MSRLVLSETDEHRQPAQCRAGSRLGTNLRSPHSEAPDSKASRPSSWALRSYHNSLAVVMACCVLFIACTAVPTPTVPVSVMEAGSVRWSFPASWHVTGTVPVQPGGKEGITFVSPEPIAVNCSVDPPSLEACWPLQRLSSDGLLVAWIPLRGLSPQPTATAWTALVSNGATARVRREVPGICGELGGDETLTAIAPTLPDGSGDHQLVSCLRGPDLTSGEAAVREILGSVRPAPIP